MSANGDIVVNETGQIKDVDSGKQLWALPGYTMSVAFSPDSRLLARSRSDCTVELWDVMRRRRLRTISEFHFDEDPDSHNEPIQVLFSGDGKRLAMLGFDKLPALPSLGEIAMVRVWNIDSNKPGRTLIGTGQIIPPMAFSPDGKTFVARGTSPDYREDPDARNTEVDFNLSTDAILLWDVQSGESKGFIKGMHDTKAVAITADNKKLITGGQRGIEVWDANTGELLGGGTEEVDAVAVSPKENLIAGASFVNRNSIVKIWKFQ